MIEFFEFLNTCSPLRTITYLLFIIGMTFLLFNGIGTIIDMVINRGREYELYQDLKDGYLNNLENNEHFDNIENHDEPKEEDTIKG